MERREEMRHQISFNQASKIIMGILGAGPSRSWVEARPDEVYGQVSWVGNVSIPRDQIASVEKVDSIPWAMGFGVHGMRGTWALNGSSSGAVKITMREPARGKVMFVPIQPHTIYFSLETPDEFVSEVTGKS
jgi:hypothetical protein